MNLLWLFKRCINSKEDCLGGLVLSSFITALKLKINTDMVELMLFFPLCVVIETKPKGFLSFFLSSPTGTLPIWTELEWQRPLSPTVNEELSTLGVLKHRGVGGGEEQLFYIDSWQPSSKNNPWPFPQKHRGQWGDGLHQLPWNIPPDINTWTRMCECFI